MTNVQTQYLPEPVLANQIPKSSKDPVNYSPASRSSATLNSDIDEYPFAIDEELEVMGVAQASPPSTCNNSVQSSPKTPAANAKSSHFRRYGAKPKSQQRLPQQTNGSYTAAGKAHGYEANSQEAVEARRSAGTFSAGSRSKNKGLERSRKTANGQASYGGQKRRIGKQRQWTMPLSAGSDMSAGVSSEDDWRDGMLADSMIGFSQEEWDAEVSGRVVLPTGLEKSLTAQILHTYETRLFPSAESIEVKRAFIEKFATVLVSEFPDWEVDIHVFGSSVNGLGSSRSDVDICLTTKHRMLEDVFLLSSVLRKYGMCTYCVPRARVPIVKAWDPELRIAADINVNNTIALHNTRMLQTFVAIDGRVRPFVMAVKHWTKCRDINDAAFGGTLSSYAWATLAIHFLQTRQPPIVPVLHPPAPSLRADKCTDASPVDLTFDDDITRLRDFGRDNTESLGYLLYAFFRTYAFEFDYRHQVVSLRNGCYLSKAEKGWDQGRPSRIFCIEEPFSTWLNLAHSANETAVEGIRQEFQRAFCILRDGGSYDNVCEVYQRPQIPVTPPLSRAQSETLGYKPLLHAQSAQQRGKNGRKPSPPKLSSSKTMMDGLPLSYGYSAVATDPLQFDAYPSPEPISAHANRNCQHESHDEGSPQRLDSKAPGQPPQRQKGSSCSPDEQLALNNHFARMSVAGGTE
ncbi:hypothetical protein IWW36_003756 [Coemansia brasiliensis]|uniref:polynucleotide adenylyltransferase n=1 Tax=Coemansia brasiliensis TaxID=2650707 RepID=A0A9W8I752_9FUNG|nr:hypothetical protein IWW36_003756 [Coemansia brasiliensis]